MTVALITGASRNIGRAIALALAHDGHDVALLARSDWAAVDGVAEEVRATGRRAHVALADVRDATDVDAAVSAAAAALGPVGVLVNNAAVRREQPFEEISDLDWREILGVVLDGAFHCSAAVLRGMREAGGGRIFRCARAAGCRTAAGLVRVGPGRRAVPARRAARRAAAPAPLRRRAP